MEKQTVNSDITETDLIYAAMELMVLHAIKEDEITTKMFEQRMNISYRSAYSILEKLVTDGILKSRKIQHDGHNVNAYSPAIKGGWAAVLKFLQK